MRAATIGFTKFNTADSPGRRIELRFGRVNPRPLNGTIVNALLKDFILNGRNPVLMPIYVLVQKDWIVPESFVSDASTPWASLPELQFTELAYGAIVDVLSGHHRTAAARLLREQYRADIAAGNVRLSKLADDESSSEDREKLTRLITLLTQQVLNSVQWLVCLIDASK